MALDLKKEFGTDRDAEEEGKRIDLGDGTWIVVRRFSSKACRRVRERLERPYGKLAKIPEKVMEDILTRQIAEGVIVDWGGIEEGGEPLDYSVDTAVRVLGSYSDLREQIFSLSVSMETFKAEDDAKAAKKSKPRSAGT